MLHEKVSVTRPSNLVGRYKRHVSRECLALQQDAEYLEELHDLELESLATADKQLYQMFPNSSDMEYEPGEEAKEEERSNGSDCDEVEVRTARRKPNAVRKAFWPGFHSELNPSGQLVANQLGLPGDHAAMPVEYQAQMSLPQHVVPVHQQYQASAPQQYQALAPHQYQGPVPEQYHPTAPQYQMPAPQQSHHQDHQLHYAQPQPWNYQHHESQHQQILPDRHYAQQGEGRAIVDAYAGAFALLHSRSSRLPSQSDTIENGPLAPWGAAQLVALAPLHLGENIYIGRRWHNARLPPMPEIPSVPAPNSTGSVSLKEIAKDKLRALALNVDAETDGAPNDKIRDRDRMISTALTSVKIKLFGQAEIEDIEGINNFMVAVLADMRCSFKSHAMKIVLDGYNLRLPLFSEEDKSTYRQDKIIILLEGSEYLHLIEKTIDGTEVKQLLKNKVLVNMIPYVQDLMLYKKQFLDE
ncbi:hypothetical protein BDR07DRAFT_1375459 [Suillus spraguei]|nr:hypothetical protein BDR07DRAFT_1375459 [Suillus spraguei]